MNQHEPISHAYLRSDLRNMIMALQLASVRSLEGAAGNYDLAYAQGFSDALRSLSVALGLGIDPAVSPQITDPHRAWSASGQVPIESEPLYWDPMPPPRKGA
jgi:hypothetical protein